MNLNNQQNLCLIFNIKLKASIGSHQSLLCIRSNRIGCISHNAKISKM